MGAGHGRDRGGRDGLLAKGSMEGGCGGTGDYSGTGIGLESTMEQIDRLLYKSRLFLQSNSYITFSTLEEKSLNLTI